MRQRLALTALAGALAVTGTVGAAPTGLATDTPRTTIVEVGGAREYVRADAASPLAGVELFLRAGLDRQTDAQNGLAALVAEVILRTPVDGVALNEAIEARGGSLSYSVSTTRVRMFLEASPETLPLLAPLLARALAAPAFDAPTLAAARTSLGERIADGSGDPRLVGLDMLRASYYRAGAGLPPLGTTAALAALGPDEARAFFARWYLRGDAFVAAVGHTGDATDAASRALIAALPAGTTPASTIATRPYRANAKRIVTHRDVSAPYVVVGFAAPSLGERDFAAALVIRSLLGDVFDRTSATTQPPAFQAVGTIYAYDAAPAQFAVWMNGSRIDPTIGLTAVSSVLSNAAKKSLAASVLRRFKETARGEWSLEALSLDERALAIGDAVALGLDADAWDAVGGAIDRVTAADVKRVAAKYFQHFVVALVLPRGGG